MRELVRRFGGLTAVDGLSFDVGRGEVFGLLGHNGAGKTTTIRLLNGILEPSAGRVEVLGLDPVRFGPEVRRRTGILTATPALDEALSPRENLLVYGAIYGVREPGLGLRVAELIDFFGLGEVADAPVRGLSSGTKQRVAMGRALVHDPQVLFLDEPTTGMDPLAAQQVRDLIARLSRNRGRTVVLCTHNLAEAQQLCDRVSILRRGRPIAQGTVAELASQAGGTPTLRIEVDQAQVRVAVDVASDVAGVLGVEGEARGLLRVVHQRRETIPAVVAALAAAGVHVYGVSGGRPSLEELYVRIHDRRGEPPANGNARQAEEPK